MRDNFRPNVRLTTNILLVIGTFLIAFNLSKISLGDRDRDSQIKEDCARWDADAITEKEFYEKYGIPQGSNYSYERGKSFCKYYRGGLF